MAQAARLNLRLQKELKLLFTDPPPWVSLPMLSDNDNFSSSSLSNIEARIEGPEETVYSKGIFTIKIQIPERYPFQPPNVTFVTPIYHPNIDNGGRICLDILNLPPKGAWTPSLNISTVLTSIGLLLSEPNPDDGLMAETSREYKYNRQAFDQKAQSWTERYANAGVSGRNNDGGISANQSMMEIKRMAAAAENAVDDNGGSQKKLRLVGEKLSLKSTTLIRRNSNDDKENVVPTRRLSLSCLQKTPAGPSSSAASQHSVNCETKSLDEDAKKASSRHHEEGGGSSNGIETIIVSDSEESDDEDDGIVRSRLSLRWKQMLGKRKG